MYNKTKQDKEHIQLELGHCGLDIYVHVGIFFHLLVKNLTHFLT